MENIPLNIFNDIEAMSQLTHQTSTIKPLTTTNVWSSMGMRTNDKGMPLPTIENACTFLEKDEKYAGSLAFNEFTRRIELRGEPINDFNISQIALDFEMAHLGGGRDRIMHALNIVGQRNSYNPVRSYLDSLLWDGKKRVETLFIKLLGAADTLLNRKMTWLWFKAAVKRIYEPGCKFDNIIILQGAQGIGKTSLCTLLSRDNYCQIS